MKRFALSLSLIALVAVAVVGCITRYTDPATGKEIYVADTNKIAAAVGSAHAVNDATAPLNPYALPVRGLIELGGVVALGISSVVAGIKNGQLKTSNAMNNAMIRGVEDANPETDSPTKKAIAARATTAGVQPVLDKLVQAVT